MAWYWRMDHVPELQAFDPHERPRVIRRCYEQLKGRADLTIRAVMVVVTAIVAMFVFAHLFKTLGYTGGKGAIDWAIVLAPMAVAALLLHRLNMTKYRALLREYALAKHTDERVPACLACGYDLRGTPDKPGSTCPECGEARPKRDAPHTHDDNSEDAS